MAFRVENKPVSRRQFYGTLVALLTLVELAVTSVAQGDVFRTRLEVFIIVAALWALLELFRTR